LVPGNLKKLCDLVDDAAPTWFDLGIQLGIKEAKLKDIEASGNNVRTCFMEMLSTWLEMAPSWENLMTALESTSVHNDLAARIRQWFENMPGKSAMRCTLNYTCIYPKESLELPT
jgi:hypothetical protein